MRGSDAGTEGNRAAAAAPLPASGQPELQGTWRQPSPWRRFHQVMLVIGISGALVGFGLLFGIQTFEAMAVLVAFTIWSLMAYTTLSVTVPTEVSLAGPVLTVRRGRESDTFDLTGPGLRRITTAGFPGRPNWRVRLEARDGRLVELGPTQVDPETVQAAIRRYRPAGTSIPRQRTDSAEGTV